MWIGWFPPATVNECSLLRGYKRFLASGKDSYAVLPASSPKTASGRKIEAFRQLAQKPKRLAFETFSLVAGGDWYTWVNGISLTAAQGTTDKGFAYSGPETSGRLSFVRPNGTIDLICDSFDPDQIALFYSTEAKRRIVFEYFPQNWIEGMGVEAAMRKRAAEDASAVIPSAQ
jgi:hypothetical protein